MTDLNIHPYAVIYNPSYDLVQHCEFIAQSFAIAIVGYTATLADLVHRYDKTIPVLVYDSMTDMRPIYSDWRVCNSEENMFLHGSDPACLHLAASDGSVVVSWRRDGRSELDIVGYNVYRATRGGSWEKINGSLLTSTIVCDSGLVNGVFYSYSVRSVGEGGTEYGFSGTADVITTSVSNSANVIGSNFSVDTVRFGQKSEVVFRFEVVFKGSLDKANLCVDVNSDWRYEGYEEIHPMSCISCSVYMCTVRTEIPINYPAGFGYYFELVDGLEIIRLPEGESNYTTNVNNRIRSASGSYKMDVASEEWREYYTRRAKSMLAKGYNGIFADNAIVRLNHHQNWADCRPEGYQDGEQWAGQMKEALASVKSALGSSLVVFNGLSLERASPLLEVTDGGMIEGFAHYSWLGGGYHPEDKWKAQMNIAMRAATRRSKAVLLLSNGDEEDAQARLFCVASYLMAKGSRSYYCYAERYQYLEYFPEYELEIGEPVDFGDSIDDYYDARHNIYRRKFTNGLVLINANTVKTAEDIPLGETLHKVTLHGGTVFNGGAVAYDPVQVISLPPRSGAIVLRDIDG